ncbi:ATP-binding protein [Massilia sp. S19_KUP03_FR1]|uniref:ATP-binding protein n=1 Tax=Massilia sp. S19_KUP03_FR1 TaxID=3025503 RepID=UPI002FCDD214
MPRKFTPTRPVEWLLAAVLIAVYVVLDWASFMDPLFGLNITPWNPDPAIGLVLWVRFGRRVALPWFIALVLAEIIVRHMPAGPVLTALLAAQLTVGYGITGEVLRRVFSKSTLVNSHERLFRWLTIVFAGLALNGALYVGLLALAGLVPPGAFVTASVRYIIGDIVGVVMSMPLLWMLVVTSSRVRLGATVRSWESASYLLLAAFLVWGVFQGKIGTEQYKHLYFLFMPIVWAAARHGLAGTGLVAFTLQASIIMVVRFGGADGIPFAELQLLGAALSLVGFFIGVIVDEQRQATESLKQSLRLAAAGEMAAALAHELNQPMAALSAYGKACEHLIARGDDSALLADSIGKMVREANRASQVVRRVREFFRSGAMHLEAGNAHEIIASVSAQFGDKCRAMNIALTIAAPAHLVLRVDRLQIELVLRNLIANAVDAVAETAPAGRRIHLSAVQRNGQLEVAVQDSGKGVSRTMAGRLFQPFASGKSSGLGLGLVLSRQIVEAHGGSLWAEAGGQGLFKFLLPMPSEEQDQMEQT